ncbi:hypothetical protein VTK73DRAFT_2425 [Phialemonium thermophilum]|uniref:Uncharacterized protein n=1 Tax=Phialemonium thermophilum TaxID=223376 RepID=A0ABR3VS40_9PEZI
MRPRCRRRGDDGDVGRRQRRVELEIAVGDRRVGVGGVGGSSPRRSPPLDRLDLFVRGPGAGRRSRHVGAWQMHASQEGSPSGFARDDDVGSNTDGGRTEEPLSRAESYRLRRVADKRTAFVRAQRRRKDLRSLQPARRLGRKFYLGMTSQGA